MALVEVEVVQAHTIFSVLASYICDIRAYTRYVLTISHPWSLRLNPGGEVLLSIHISCIFF